MTRPREWGEAADRFQVNQGGVKSRYDPGVSRGGPGVAKDVQGVPRYDPGVSRDEPGVAKGGKEWTRSGKGCRRGGRPSRPRGKPEGCQCLGKYQAYWMVQQTGLFETGNVLQRNESEHLSSISSVSKDL